MSLKENSMKTKLPVLYLAALLSILLFMTVSGAAQTYSLSSPQGLALDSLGNLYVANNGGNNVLVYSPSYVQLSAKTLTQNIANPTSVAFDPSGYLWVDNAGNHMLLSFS